VRLRWIFLIFSALLLAGPLRATEIMGQDDISPERLADYLLSRNPRAGDHRTRRLAAIYFQECRREGVRPLVAFAQMCQETGHLRFSGAVSRRQNNFCGLGCCRPGVAGERFPSVRIGVRAHVQHLKAYASPLPLRSRCVDRNRRWVALGSVPTVEGLTGRWAMDPHYGDSIVKLMKGIATRKP
jgi:hypothetical protein